MTVRNVEVNLHGPEHDSALDAIEFAQDFDRKHRQQHQTLLLGRIITWVDWTEERLSLGVEGGAALSLRVDGGVIAPSIATNDVEGRASERDPIDLIFTPNIRSTWDRAALAGSLVGETLRNIFVTPDQLFLYVSQPAGEVIIAASVLIDADRGTQFLYWDVSE